MAHIIVFGDSTTYGAWDSQGGWVQRMREKLDVKNIQGKHYFLIYNLGISGDTSKGMLKRFEHELIPRLDDAGENIVIISGGGNDALYSRKTKKHWVEIPAFKRNYARMIAIARKHTQKIIVTGVEPCDETKTDPVPWEPTVSYLEKHIERYNEALKSVCEKENVQFLNFFGKLNNKKFIATLGDGIHPNDKRQQMMEKIVWDAMKGKGWI